MEHLNQKKSNSFDYEITEKEKQKESILYVDNFDFTKYATPISKITNIDNEIANRISKEIFEKQLEEGDSDDPKWDIIYERILANYGLTLEK